MSSISGFSDVRKKKEDAKRNELYIGGIDQRGGGSGLSVLGPPENRSVFDSIVQKASSDSQNTDDRSADHQVITKKITMFKNGFTVDDGPFRDLVSPENKLFLSSLERGDVPVGLFNL
jgi:UBX domain-containing protein 1